MKKSLIFSFLSIVIIIALSNCKKEDKVVIPDVTTDTATMVSMNSAILNGSVNDEGGSAVTARGFCISADPNPGLNDMLVSSGFGPGEFSEEISLLQPNTTYYYKAFATNGVGTAFGQEYSFTTEPEADPGPMLNLKGGFGFTSSDVTIAPGELIRVGVVGISSHVSSNKLVRFKMTETSMGLPSILLDSVINTENFDWDTYLSFLAETGNIELEFEITDAGGMKAFRTLHLTITAQSDPGPSLILKSGVGYTSGDVTVSTGATIKVGVLGEKSSVSGNKLTRFRFIYTINNVPLTLLDSTLNADNFNWETNFTFSNAGIGSLSFELTDFGNMKATKSFNVTVQSPEVVKYIDIELGSWNDQTGSFFSTSEGIVYNIAQTYAVPANQAKIDFLFFKGVTNGNTIASPDDVDANMILEYKLNLWTNKNQTRFNTTNITAAQFDAIGTSYEFPEFDINSQTTKANQLEEGDVILFKRQSGKLGLIKIVDLYTKGDKMKIDVIIEK